VKIRTGVGSGEAAWTGRVLARRPHRRLPVALQGPASTSLAACQSSQEFGAIAAERLQDKIKVITVAISGKSQRRRSISF
jgi:hypothetical protein